AARSTEGNALPSVGVPTCREGPVNVAGMVVAPAAPGRAASARRRPRLPGFDARRNSSGPSRGQTCARSHPGGNKRPGSRVERHVHANASTQDPRERTMQFGIFTVGDVTTDPTTGRTPDDTERVRAMLTI